MKGKLIKRAMLGLLVVGLALPFMKVDYASEEGIEVRRYSIISSLIEDVREQNFLTLQLLYGILL